MVMMKNDRTVADLFGVEVMQIPEVMNLGAVQASALEFSPLIIVKAHKKIYKRPSDWLRQLCSYILVIRVEPDGWSSWVPLSFLHTSTTSWVRLW